MDVSVESGRGESGRQKMAGAAGARPDLNRERSEIIWVKRTLISRFNFYLTLRKREKKIQFLCHLDGDFGEIKLIFPAEINSI